MSSHILPLQVRAFLDAHVRSHDELRILLTLVEGTARWWDAPGMAAEVHLTKAQAQNVLEAFAARNLLDIRIRNDIRYRLRAGTPELEADLRALEDIYRRSPAAVLGWGSGHVH